MCPCAVEPKLSAHKVMPLELISGAKISAQANRISHPKNVYLKESDVLRHVDDWLTELFDADAIGDTVTQLTEQAGRLEDPAAQARAEAVQAGIAEYDAQISRYRASVDARGDPAVIGSWIAETQAKKVAAPTSCDCLQKARPASTVAARARMASASVAMAVSCSEKISDMAATPAR